MNFGVARPTGGELLPVQRIHNCLEAGCFLLLHFSDVAYVVHFHLFEGTADAARLAEFRARSHSYGHSHQVYRPVIGCKGISFLLPVAVTVKRDKAVSFAVPRFDFDCDVFAIPDKDLFDRDSVFCSESSGKRKSKDVLDMA